MPPDSIQSFESKLALYDQMGKEHLNAQGGQKTSNWMGRLVSRLSGTGDSLKAANAMIKSIRNTPGFGDKYALMARAKLKSAMSGGTPLSGRTAARVMRDVKIAKNEDLAKSANIGINIDHAIKGHKADFEQILDRTHVTGTNGKESFLKLTGEQKTTVLNEARSLLKTQFKEKSPNLDQMKALVAGLAQNIAKTLATLGSHTNFDLALKTASFMGHHPEIPSGAAGIVQRVFSQIPKDLQTSALNLVAQETTPPNALPVTARVVARPDGSPYFACATKANADPRHVAKELSASFSVSAGRIGGLNLCKQFAIDLPRSDIQFSSPRGQTAFTAKEGAKADGTQALSDKLTKACRGSDKEAFGLSVLLNQQFPGAVTTVLSQQCQLEVTGGGGLIIGPGLEHGSYKVESHGDGRYTVNYSATAQADCFMGGSLDNSEIPVQYVKSDGHSISISLGFSYTVDLSDLKDPVNEAQLAPNIEFNTEPEVHMEMALHKGQGV